MGYADWLDDEDEEKTTFGSTEKSTSTIIGDFDTIPVLDVSGMFHPDIEERKIFADKLRDACTQVGFFYIDNHGIPDELVDGAFEWGKKFFALPFEEKMEIYIDNTPHYRGYTPLQGSGKPDKEGKGNANEAFDYGHDSKLNDDPNDEWVDTYMRGVNPWPRQLPGFEEHFSIYYRTLRQFCRVMTKSVALSLDLPEDYFQKYVTHPGCSSLIAHYPPQTPGSDLAKGLDAHTDAEFLTILAPGDVRALEVVSRSGQWISAPPRPGSFIVNVGDQLQAMTNDLYVSTRHRVINWSGQERYSIPFFFSVNFETVIEPIPSLITGKKVAKHPPLTAGQLHRIAETNPKLLEYRKPLPEVVVY